jgi:CHAT domain-containing protein
MERGAQALRTGQLRQALESYGRAVELHAEAGDARGESVALSHLAQAQEALGEYGEAARSLEQARALAEPSGDEAWMAALLGALGNVHIALGPAQEAERLLQRARALARQAGAPGLEASIAINLANHRAHQGQLAEALALSTEAAALASQAGDTSLAARALANAARASLEQGDPQRAEELADRARASTQDLEPGHDKAMLLIHLARSYSKLADASPARADASRQRAYQLLGEASTLAASLKDARAASYALGHQGALYERSGRYEEALALTRRAILHAQQVEAPEALYLWDWQAARLLRAQGRQQEAIETYELAVRVLQELRPRMSLAYGPAGTSFRERVEPLYLELVDVLLRRAVATDEPEAREALLLRVRNHLESLKAAELRDYFRDECVDVLRAKLRRVEESDPGAAIVYPILLPDRLEILLSLPESRMRRFSSGVGSERVTAEIRRLRYLLEKRTTREYLPHAQQIHRWLVAPFEAELAAQGVDTLVFVPDGPLRTIPMSALHDGERFLVERYAVAITPGVELTDPRPLDREAMGVLVAGLGQAVGGFRALRYVPQELSAVQRLVGGEMLLDEAFLVDALREHLARERLSLVHIATHARFDADVDEAFLLAYDGRLTMDQLADYVGLFRFRDEPLELLTLSACETAQGDDRAALGLSGIAIKAGARSVLGTLWTVNDLAAAELMVRFYERLHDPAFSRAAALQRAQLELLGDLRYRHPGYWSAFLLISNWL